MPKGLKTKWDHRTPSVSVRLITCERVVPFGITCTCGLQWSCSSFNPVNMRQQTRSFPCTDGSTVLSHNGPTRAYSDTGSSLHPIFIYIYGFLSFSSPAYIYIHIYFSQPICGVTMNMMVIISYPVLQFCSETKKTDSRLQKICRNIFPHRAQTRGYSGERNR